MAAILVLGTCSQDETTGLNETATVSVTPQGTSAISHTLLTAGNNASNQDVYTTAAIAPAAKALVTVAVLGHNASGASPSPVLTGGGMTSWTVVASATFDPIGTPTRRVTIYRAMSASPGSGPLTITFSGNQRNAQWIVSQWSGVDVTGANGAGAIVQSGTARADAVTGLTVQLGPFANTNNVAYGAFGVTRNAAVVTPGGGFTEISEQPSGEPAPGDLQAEWRTNDNTIDATWGTLSLNAAAVGVEIRSPGVDPLQSSLTASPTSIAAGGGTATITVTARDANGNPIPGATVVLAATGTDNTLTQPAGTTNASGIATGTLSSTAAGDKVVSATINGTGVTPTATVSVTPAGVNAAQSTVTAAPGSITASSGGSASAITVTARDQFGNLIQGATVVLAATGTGNTLTPPAGTTNASGVAMGTLSSIVVGDKVVSATVGGIGITETATVTVTPAAAAQVAFLVEPSSVTAGATMTPAVQVEILDPFNNRVTTVTNGVALAIGTNPAGGTLTGGGAVAAVDGVATFAGLRIDKAATGYTLAASSTGLTGATSAAFNVTAGSVSAAQSTVTAAPAAITAGSGASASTITVTARDASGNPIQGVTVILAATGSGNTLTQPADTTNASGIATGTLSSTAAGDKVVSATISGTGVTQTATVSVTPVGVNAAQSSVTAAPGSITASSGGSASAITVTARDQFDNPIQGATVILAATGSGNTLTQPAGTTNASGVAMGTLSSSTVGDKVVSAEINATGVTQTATVTVTPAAAAQVAFLVEPSSVTAGATMTPAVQVEIRDPFSNRVTAATNGVALAIGTNPAGGTLTGGGTVAAVNGMASFPGLSLDKAGTGYTLQATSGALTAATSSAFNVTVAAVSAAQSSITAAPGSITAGSGVSTITVTARDASGNPIAGATVALTASGTGNTLTPPASTTNASGVATGTLSSTVAEAKTVSATVTVGGVTTAILQTATVTVTPQGTSEISHMLLTAGSNTVNEKVSTTAPISPAANALVTVAVLGINATEVSPSPVLMGGGMTTWTVVASATFDAIGAPTRRVTIYRAMSAAPGSGPLTITFSATQGNVQWIVSQWSGVDQTGVNGAGAIVQSGTAQGDAVTGLTVQLGPFANANNVAYGAFGVTRNAAVVTPGAGFTEIAEQPSGETTPGDLQAEWRTNDNTIDATWGALSLNAAAVGVEITAAAAGSAPPVVDAGQSSVEASPTSIAAGGTATITVTARDASGMPVSGASVELFTTGTGNTLTQPAGTTNASGIATGTLRSTATGSKVVSATINGTGVTQTVTVTVSPAAAAQLAFVVQPSSVTAGATMAPPVQVEIRDQFTNRVTSATNSVALAIGTNPVGGTLTGGGSVAAVNGEAQFAGLRLDKAASGYTLAASSTGLTGAGSTSFNVTAGSVSPAQSTVTAAPGSIAAGSEVSTITVTARDASGNPIAGATVALTVSGTGNSLTQPAGTTNASGVASGTLSSTVAEEKSVSATVTVGGVTTAISQTATVTVTPQGTSAISHTLLTAGNDPVNKSAYTTASIAPAPNTLVLVAVLGRKPTGASPSPALSGGGMTSWTEVATVTFDPIGAPTRRLTIYRAMSAAPGSGPLTITFTASQGNAQWIVSQWDGVETSGVNGAGTIVQTGAAQGDAVSGLTVPLAAFGHADNVAYGAFGVTSSAPVVTPGAAFTEISEQPSGESTPGDLQTQWAPNVNTIDATWTALNGAALGVEIKGANTGPVVPVASVEVTPASATVDEGKTVQLTATLRDANGNVLSGRVVTWTSSNTATATVSASGLVTGKAGGSATITATNEGYSGTSAITVVRGPVASVSVAPLSASVHVGFTTQLTATPKDASGAPLWGRTITWLSGNTVMATVNGSGLVSGVAEGVVTITATSEGQSGSSTITVLAAPPPGSGVVLVGAGDIAGCSSSGDEATAALLDAIPGTVFTAGDNAYTSGTATQFTNCYDPTWGRHRARTRPAPGNHDYNTSGATGYYGYFGALAGPAGLGYYSYDLGDWHLISLNSNIAMSAGSVQEQWLRADLAATTKQCVLAYWHHPRFSSGTHGSSTIPQPLWQALYDFDADVIISAHDHNYQRFAPQTPAGAADPVRGIRQFIAGTGGISHYTFTTPIANTEAYNTDTWGVLKLTLFPDGYSWEFIPVAGKTYTDSGSASCH